MSSDNVILENKQYLMNLCHYDAVTIYVDGSYASACKGKEWNEGQASSLCKGQASLREERINLIPSFV